MEIKKLYLGHFGKFHNKEIELDSGINLIYGENEAGKSTVHSFIRSMFFGIEKKRGKEPKDEPYSRFLPWEMPGAYQGGMKIEKSGKEYQLTRSFLAKERSYSLVDTGSGRELTEEDALFPHFNELIYRNTISIEQLASGTDKEFAKGLQNFIANLSTAHSSEVDIAKALQILKDKKKELEHREKEAQSKERELFQKMEQLKSRVNRYDELSIELSQLIEEKQILEQEFEQKCQEFSGNRLEELSGIMEKFQSYNALETELAQYKESLEKIDKRIHNLESGTASQILDADLKKLNRLQEECRMFEKLSDAQLDEREEKLAAHTHTKSIFCTTVAVFGLLLTIGMAIASIPVGIAAGILIIIAGGIFYLILTARLEKERRAFQDERQHLIEQRLALGDKKKEVLVRNYVVDSDALRKEYNIRIAEEAELRQLKERQKDYMAADQEKIKRKQKLFQELKEYAALFGMEEFSEESPAMGAAGRLAEHVNKMKEEEQKAKQAYKMQREEMLKKEERIRWEISTIAGASVELEEISKNRREYLENISNCHIEIQAVELAVSTIKELSAQIHDTFGDKLNRSISERVKEITQGKYSEIVMDEQMAVKVLSHNGYIPLEKLSAGTVCQVYLAVRLAMAEIFFPEEEMPLLFDDAFALYDEERLKAALSYLAGRNNQIILFTCHNREKRILEQMNIPYHEVVL